MKNVLPGSSPSSRASIAGFSLVEALVGMAVGVVALLVVLKVFALGEGHNRTTTSGADAQQNGAVALYLLEHEIAKAGYGIMRPLPVPASCLDPSVVIDGTAGANTVTIMYSTSADGNARREPCDTAAGNRNVVYRKYFVANNGLRVEDLSIDGATVAGSAADLADGVVAMTAQALPSGENPTGVRIAVVARSDLREKPDAATRACATTTVTPIPDWTGGTPPDPPNDGSDLPDSWKCYRYKVYETIVPLRNMIWS